MVKFINLILVAVFLCSPSQAKSQYLGEETQKLVRHFSKNNELPYFGLTLDQGCKTGVSTNDLNDLLRRVLLLRRVKTRFYDPTRDKLIKYIEENTEKLVAEFIGAHMGVE